MSINTAAGTRITLLSDMEKLGERLIRFGQALKNPDTTVRELTALANSCGVALKLRAVAETGGEDEAGA